MCVDFNQKMYSIRCIIVWASLLSWLRFAAAYNFPLTSIDARTSNYLRQEEEAWRSFPRPNLTDSIEVIYTTHSSNLDFNHGLMEYIWPYSDQLAQNITELNRTASRVLELVKKRSRWDLQNLADFIIRDVPRKLNAIFAEVKSLSFQQYLSTNSDPCQSATQWGAYQAQLEGFTQNVAKDVYKTILEGLTKGYMVSQLSYMILIANAEVKYKKESQALRHTFTANYQSFVADTSKILSEEKNIIWNCDAYHLNDSYTQITNLWQGYIDNEANIDVNGSCTGKCSDFTFTHNYRCLNDTLCARNYFDKNKTKCEGEIRDCVFMESDMWICPNEDDDQPGKRYNYIRYGSGKVLGKPSFCPQEVQLKSWQRWFVECSYCLCYCDTTGINSDRYFSLREALSNVTDNRIVTGIQFIKHNHIIHLAISERQLRSNGGLYPAERSSTTWKSDFNFRINDTDVVEYSENYHLNGRNADYYRLNVQNAAIDLDILQAPAGAAVTGARLRIVNNHIRFEIRVTPFNYETGDLEKNRARSYWIGNNAKAKKRIFEQRPDVPTRTPRPSMRDRQTDTYIEFGYSDLEKDISQTTVPFIETLPVEAHIPSILVGAGLYYKTQSGYGGFIAPLLLTHNGNEETIIKNLY